LILTLVTVVLPVFLVIAGGYAATRTGLFPDAGVNGLMTFTQNFAVPCLLFRGVVDLDLGAVFDLGLLVAFYAGAFVCFGLGIVGERVFFRRRPGEAVAIGFGALFSNSLLLGIPIMERAYGPGALAPNFAILSIHAPICYLIGITVMEFTRADGRGLGGTGQAVARAMFRNALMIGVLLGFIVNFSGVNLPEPPRVAVDMMADAALPAALFGIGGVLTRYTLRAQLGEAGLIAALSLILHPTITYLLAHVVFDLPSNFVRSAVVTASMAPGVNAYVFANLYARGQAQAASVVLLATGVSVLTISVWLSILGHLP
jgi:malonate transporter and related proteins